jgi:phosphoglycerate kinase
MNIDFSGKKALVRVDFNVPLNKETLAVTDDTRIRRALPTLTHILEEGGAVILMSHLGRPQKSLKEDGSIDVERFSLKNIVGILTDLIGVEVQFCDETVGNKAMTMATNLKRGQVMLLENTRFHTEEKNGDKAFAEQLAGLGDVYVNDAFGTAHRAHASTTTVAEFFEEGQKCFGLLMENELTNAAKVTDSPERPFVAIVGGSKVSDKMLLLDKLVDQVDTLIIGGGMAYTFMKARGGQIGNSLCEDDRLELATELVKKAKEKGVNLLLPADSIVAEEFSNDAKFKVTPSDMVPDGWMGLDIGMYAQNEFRTAISEAKTILWNGPMGVFEMSNFANGTKLVAQAVAAATKEGAFSLVGGGDSVAAVNQLGLSKEVSYVSTGGGAMLELLEGKELPGVKAISSSVDNE